MAKQFEALEPEHIRFIADQPLFFVGTAAEEGRVNISPKGMDTLRVLSPSRILWLNLTGSGNETAGHLARMNRITLMWCSFGVRPLILRAYGRAELVPKGAPRWGALAAAFPAIPGARQVCDVAVDLVQTSCGYAVPLMEAPRERPTLRSWAEAKGEAGLGAYWQEKNRRTIDGFPAPIPR